MKENQDKEDILSAFNYMLVDYFIGYDPPNALPPL
jgi:hypothetical protein